MITSENKTEGEGHGHTRSHTVTNGDTRAQVLILGQGKNVTSRQSFFSLTTVLLCWLKCTEVGMFPDLNEIFPHPLLL